MRTPILFLLSLLALVGCYNRPGQRTANDSEHGAIETLREAVNPALECEALEPGNVFVWEAPQREVARYCSGGRRDTGIIACVTSTYANGVFTPGMTANISWDSGWNLHHNLVRHEAFHTFLGCELGHNDRHHRDPRWTDGTLSEARELFIERFTEPDVDPYTRNPRRPWNLTGTPWEGEDCHVQPHAWIHEGLVPGCLPDGGFPSDSGI